MNQEIKNEVPRKKRGLSIFVIFLGLVLIGVGAFLLLGKDATKKESNTNNNNKQAKESYAEKYEGIYANNDDKLFIRKTEDNKIHYVISGNFEGEAITDKNSAKQTPIFDESNYFTFKLIENGIELEYHTDEDSLLSVATGKYTKIAEYSKDNVYKEAVGDASFLNSKYSGLFKGGDIELYLYQINEKEVKVEAIGDVMFSELFVIESDNKLVAKDLFKESENAYIITFNDKQFNLDVNENVFGYDEDDKELELTYSLEKTVTQDDIINNFYSRY